MTIGGAWSQILENRPAGKTRLTGDIVCLKRGQDLAFVGGDECLVIGVQRDAFGQKGF